MFYRLTLRNCRIKWPQLIIVTFQSIFRTSPNLHLPIEYLIWNLHLTPWTVVFIIIGKPQPPHPLSVEFPRKHFFLLYFSHPIILPPLPSPKLILLVTKETLLLFCFEKAAFYIELQQYFLLLQLAIYKNLFFLLFEDHWGKN